MLLKWIHDAYRIKDVCSASIIDLNAKYTLYIHLLGHLSYLPQKYSVLMDIMMVKVNVWDESLFVMMPKNKKLSTKKVGPK